MPMVFTISFASAAILCVVMYLMMKVMIDRSAYNISLIKVFGYKKKEVKKLFPFMISNVTCGLNIKAPILFFVIAYLIIIGLYFIINTILVRRLNKFTPAEVLKNRE